MVKDFFKDEVIQDDTVQEEPVVDEAVQEEMNEDIVMDNVIVNDEIIIKESTLDDVIKVHRQIPEFELESLENDEDLRAYFENRYKDKEKIIIVGYLNDEPIGYIIGYDKFSDGESFYCWMAGVAEQWRRIGTLTGLMYYQKAWAKKHGYSTLKIKTRNTRREMLSFLVKDGFNFTSVDTRDDIENNRINLQIDL